MDKYAIMLPTAHSIQGRRNRGATGTRAPFIFRRYRPSIKLTMTNAFECEFGFVQFGQY